MNVAKFFGASGIMKLYMQIRVMQYRDGVNYPLSTFWTDRELSIIKPENVYFFTPGLRRFKKSIVEGSFTVWIDLDTPEIPTWYVKPSLLICTGHGHHAYWLLNDFCMPEELGPILKRLIHFYKADPATSDITRFMRYPESYNQKFSPAHFCEIIDQDINRRYDANHLIPIDYKTT